ncbi:MAG: VWA domain-containing protein [Nannocystaceae bacterium]
MQRHRLARVLFATLTLTSACDAKLDRAAAGSHDAPVAYRGEAKSEAKREEYRVAAPAGRPSEEMDQGGGGESYATIVENVFQRTLEDATSTFSIDVDTAAYSNVRRFLRDGSLPPADAVRIEELVNYFDYDYPQPDGEVPFSVHGEVGPCPWAPGHQLVHIGLQGKQIAAAEVPARNLVFLLDVSGSMNSADKLPLLTRGLGLLVDGMRKQDRVAIVVYAGASGVVLEPTSDKAEIRAALDRLESGGSTNGGAGIELAYRLAEKSFVEGGINRVILATDGDFNVGTTSQAELVKLIERKRASGVFLSVLGFGSGNLKDSTMEMLADKGNGNYAYIDSLDEARKVLVQEAGSTLVTIAKDVKIQVEFDPARVESYRLVGYENRVLADRDFADDRKDAGEIGAGHGVTAVRGRADRSRQGRLGARDGGCATSSRRPTTAVSCPRASRGRRRAAADLDDFRFAAAVAEFGLLLRDSRHKGDASWAQDPRARPRCAGPRRPGPSCRVRGPGRVRAGARGQARLKAHLGAGASAAGSARDRSARAFVGSPRDDPPPALPLVPLGPLAVRPGPGPRRLRSQRRGPGRHRRVDAHFTRPPTSPRPRARSRRPRATSTIASTRGRRRCRPRTSRRVLPKPSAPPIGTPQPKPKSAPRADAALSTAHPGLMSKGAGGRAWALPLCRPTRSRATRTTPRSPRMRSSQSPTIRASSTFSIDVDTASTATCAGSCRISSCRRPTPCASRSWSTTSTTTTPRPRAVIRSR